MTMLINIHVHIPRHSWFRGSSGTAYGKEIPRKTCAERGHMVNERARIWVEEKGEISQFKTADSPPSRLEHSIYLREQDAWVLNQLVRYG